MATFEYKQGYTQKELFDHLVCEMTVVKSLNIPCFEVLLNNMIQDVQNREMSISGTPFIPTLPSTSQVDETRKKLHDTCGRIAEAITKKKPTTTNEGQFVTSKGKCPDCGEFKTHLANYLKGKHGWSVSNYAQYAASGRRPPKFQLPEKSCPLDCTWKGLRFDMHLQRNHKMNQTTQEYKDLYLKSKQDRTQQKRQPQSAATSTTTTTTMTMDSDDININDENRNEHQQEHKGENDEDDEEEEDEEEEEEEAEEEEEEHEQQEQQDEDEDSMTDASTSMDEEEEDRERFGGTFQPPTTFHALVKAWRSHMQTPDGGLVPLKQVNIVCAQVSLVADTTCKPAT